MNEDEKEPYYDDYQDENDDGYQDDRPQRTERYRDEIFSKRVPAGKRTYFFDVKSTRSGSDFFLTITESKKVGENRYEKHKVFPVQGGFRQVCFGDARSGSIYPGRVPTRL